MNYGKERGTVTKPLDENEGFTCPSQHFKCKAENDGVSPEHVDATQEGEQVLNPVSSETSLHSSSFDENDTFLRVGETMETRKKIFRLMCLKLVQIKMIVSPNVMRTRHNSPFKNLKFWNQLHTPKRQGIVTLLMVTTTMLILRYKSKISHTLHFV